MGLMFIGVPVWLLVHRLGLRGVAVFIIVGMAAPVAGLLACEFVNDLLSAGAHPNFQQVEDGRILRLAGRRTIDGWFQYASGAALLALPGAVVGWTMWIVAYGPFGKFLSRPRSA